MIDRGLLVSLIAMALTVAAVSRLAPPRTLPPDGVLEAGLWAVLAGVLSGRAVALLLDDPAGLARLSDFVILRGGVELWPGVAVGAAIVALAARRAAVPMAARLADLAPYGLAAYAVYEAACVARDGCFGPRSVVGLRPGGAGSRQFPVGVVVALAVALLAAAVRRRAVERPWGAVMLAVGGLAGARAVAAIWLPRLGDGPTRQHLASVVVAVAVTTAAWSGRAVQSRRPAAGGGRDG